MLCEIISSSRMIATTTARKAHWLNVVLFSAFFTPPESSSFYIIKNKQTNKQINKGNRKRKSSSLSSKRGRVGWEGGWGPEKCKNRNILLIEVYLGSGLSLGVGFAFLGKIMQYDAKQRLRNFVYPVIVLPCPQIDISFYLLNMSSFELGKEIKEEK